MSIQALARVALVHPFGDMGDRQIQGISTLLSNHEWHFEADYHRGSIGDVSVYRNTKCNTPDEPPNWEWYAAIPVANIKVYRLAGALPAPATLQLSEAPVGESQAKNQATGASSSRASAQ